MSPLRALSSSDDRIMGTWRGVIIIAKEDWSGGMPVGGLQNE